MNCFVHRDQPAVGLCKSCGRGLCPECLVDYPTGLACKNRCEERVALITRIVDNNKQTLSASNVRLKYATASSILLGLLFCALGFVMAITWPEKGTIVLGMLFVAMGLVFLITGLLGLRRRAKLPQP